MSASVARSIPSQLRREDGSASRNVRIGGHGIYEAFFYLVDNRLDFQPKVIDTHC